MKDGALFVTEADTTSWICGSEDRRSGEAGDRVGKTPGVVCTGLFVGATDLAVVRHAAGHRHADASVKVTKLSPNAKVPVKATDGAAGYDLFASEGTVIPASEVRDGRVEIGHALVATGIAISLPPATSAGLGRGPALDASQHRSRRRLD